MAKRLYITVLASGWRDYDSKRRKAVSYMMKRQKSICPRMCAYADREMHGWAVANTRRMRRVLRESRVAHVPYTGWGVDVGQLPGRREGMRVIKAQLRALVGTMVRVT